MRRSMRRHKVGSLYCEKSTLVRLRTLPSRVLSVAGALAAWVATGISPRLRTIRLISAPICSGGRIQSTLPVSIADCGMPLYLAVSGSWEKVKPPAALIAWIPAAPSEPVPERMMPIVDSPTSSASEAKKRLTDGLGIDSRAGSTSRKYPSLSVRLRFGGVM